MIIVGVICIFVTISFIKDEIHKILFGIANQDERIRNSLRRYPRKYGDELTKKQKVTNIIMTLFVGVWFICIGIAWIYFPIISIINNVK